MLTIEIKGFEDDAIIFDDAHNSVHVSEDATVSSGISDSMKDLTGIHDNVYRIDGWVWSGEIGIALGGNSDSVSIGATGHVAGALNGILLGGNASHLANAGEIVGGLGRAGILVTGGSGITVRNFGLITGGVGAEFHIDKGLLVNGKQGIISGSDCAINLDFDDTARVTVINHGLLVGSTGIAFASDIVTATLINDGVIRGDVVFGSGGMTLDNRGGAIRGEIIGGSADDTLIVDSAKYRLSEQSTQDYDTVKSTVSYTLNDNVEALTLIGRQNVDATGNAEGNDLKGNVGSNLLKGAQGADFLDGGKGDDRLYGGAGQDHFEFKPGTGHDTIEDYHAGDDAVLVIGWRAIRDIDDILAHSHADHGNSVIEIGADSMTLKGIHLADLNAVHFVINN